jgi:uncharacterized protein
MEIKDYINAEMGDERRFLASPVEFREGEGDEKGKIEGIAAVVNKRTNLFWFEEEILPGAFDDVLNDDVRALFNHDPNFVLARSNGGKGTLELFITKSGDLGYRYQTPDRSYAKDLEDAIRSGDVSQSSFAFRVKEEKWIHAEDEKSLDVRQIVKFEILRDVSPVTYPAYQDTSVAKRSYESVKPKEKKRKQILKLRHAKNRQLL